MAPEGIAPSVTVDNPRDIGFPLAALLMVLACFALGQAVQAQLYVPGPTMMVWLGVAIAALLLVPFTMTVRIRFPHAGKLALALIGLAFALQFMQMVATPPGVHMRNLGQYGWLTFQKALAVAGMFAGMGLADKPAFPRLGALALVLAYWVVGDWIIHVEPAPMIDVYHFQRDASEALWNGKNPYALRPTDIYGGAGFYGPGLSVNGTLQFGFPYTPLSLLLVMPAQIMMGDYRFAMLAAVMVAVLVIMLVRPSAAARTVGAIFLLTPRAFMVVEQGWTEPLVFLCLALVVLAAEKRPALTPYALGLLLSSKQYTLFMAPLALLLLPESQRDLRGALRFFGKTALTGFMVTAPFVLWSPSDFYVSAIKLHIQQPFRQDSLSFLALFSQVYGWVPATSWAFGLTLLTLALCLWRMPRGPTGFVCGVLVTYAVFFAINKQAFTNYYYLLMGVAALGTALIVGERDAARTPNASG
jgi:hypothetical protein